MPGPRIGIVGIENSHVDHLIHHLNVERRFAGQVAALAGGDRECAESLSSAGGGIQLVDTVEEMLPLADALIVTDRHGRLHREHAMPFLAAGRPVLVDKPLACDVRDAEAMIAAAREHDAPLTSYSALRWLDAFTDTQSDLDSLGALQLITATGPSDPDDQHGGVFFYGSHSVNVALGLSPDGPISDVRVDRFPDAVIASATVGGVRVQVNLIRPSGSEKVPFEVSVIGKSNTVNRQFILTEEYLANGLEVFLRMVETGVPPISYDLLGRDVAFLAAIDAGSR